MLDISTPLIFINVLAFYQAFLKTSVLQQISPEKAGPQRRTKTIDDNCTDVQRSM